MLRSRAVFAVSVVAAMQETEALRCAQEKETSPVNAKVLVCIRSKRTRPLSRILPS